MCVVQEQLQTLPEIQLQDVNEEPPTVSARAICVPLVTNHCRHELLLVAHLTQLFWQVLS